MDFERFVLVYDADAGIWGELRYVAGKLSGVSRCAACDITHGFALEKRSWKQARAAIGRPLVQLHRNELDAAMAATAAGRFPCVLGAVGDEYRVVAVAEDLAQLHGSPLALAALLNRRLVA